MVDWIPIISTLTALSPVLFMIIAYIKTWSRFEVTVSNLSSSVEKLSILIEDTRGKLISYGERLSRLEATVSELTARERMRGMRVSDTKEVD